VYFQRLPDGRIHLKVEQSAQGWTLEMPVGTAVKESHEILSGEAGTDQTGNLLILARGPVLEVKYRETNR
jgi:hypothetical protein